MKTILRTMVLGICAGLLFTLDQAESPESPMQVALTLVPEAQAIYGVRRRAVRRGVIIGSSVAAADEAAATAAATSTTAAPAASSASAGTPPAEGDVPIGTVVNALPADCTVSNIKGVQYHVCAGAYYRAAFQGNNLVYVVTQP